jgi:hypothetical protein
MPTGQMMTSSDPLRKRDLEDSTRRLACDRCRGQKLRCERITGKTTSPCRRCVKARARCTTHSHGRGRRPVIAHPIKERNKLHRKTRSYSFPEIWNFDFPNVNPEAAVSGEQIMLTPSSPHPPLLDNSLGKAPVFEPIASDIADRLDINTQTAMLNQFSTLEPLFDISHSLSGGSISSTYSTGSTLSKDSGILIPESPLSGNDTLDFNLLSSASMGGEGAGSASDWIGNLDIQTELPASPFGNPVHALEQGSTSTAKGPSQDLYTLCSVLLDSLSQFDFGRCDDEVQPPPYSIPDQAISNMFQSSERLLEILHCFKHLSTPASSPRLPGLENQTLDNGVVSLPPQVFALEERPTSGSGEPIDMTAKITVLNSLSCLLRIYEYVFARIHALLSSPSAACDVEASFPALPLLNFGSYKLDKHFHLRLRIIGQVSTYLITQIEETVKSSGLSEIDERIGTSLLDIVVGRTGNNGENRLAVLKAQMNEVVGLASIKKP